MSEKNSFFNFISLILERNFVSLQSIKGQGEKLRIPSIFLLLEFAGKVTGYYAPQQEKFKLKRQTNKLKNLNAFTPWRR